MEREETRFNIPSHFAQQEHSPMNAVQTLQQSEAKLAAAIEAATQVVTGIGTGRLDGALRGFTQALDRASNRLREVLATFSELAGNAAAEYATAAAAIEEDIASSTMPSNPPAVTQETPAAVERTNAPPVAQTQPEAKQTQEKGKAETGHTMLPVFETEPTGSDGATVEPVNRVADLIGAEPSTNGHTRGATKGKGKGRGKGK